MILVSDILFSGIAMPWLLAEADSNYWPLAFPGAVLACLAILGYLAGTTWWSLLDKWLSASRRNRLVFTSAGLVTGFVATVAVLLPDFPAIQKGNIAQKDVWWLCFVAASGAIGIWVPIMNLLNADSWNERLEQAMATAHAEAEHASEEKQRAFFNSWVSHCFLKAIGIKRGYLSDATKKPRVDSPHEVLKTYYGAANPPRQVAALVTVVHDIYYALLPDIFPKPKMRVAYFRVQDGKMALCYCWDGVSNDCLKTNRSQLAKKFKLPCGKPCYLAVQAAYSGEIEIVEDAEFADQDDSIPFKFLGASQKHRIRSMVAMPLGNPGDLEYHSHVVCIDTTHAGFFQESQREQLDIVKRNLEHRLLCEQAMDDLLAPAIKPNRRS